MTREEIVNAKREKREALQRAGKWRAPLAQRFEDHNVAASTTK